jgi:hypothetical protein
VVEFHSFSNLLHAGLAHRLAPATASSPPPRASSPTRTSLFMAVQRPRSRSTVRRRTRRRWRPRIAAAMSSPRRAPARLPDRSAEGRRTCGSRSRPMPRTRSRSPRTCWPRRACSWRRNRLRSLGRGLRARGAL